MARHLYCVFGLVVGVSYLFGVASAFGQEPCPPGTFIDGGRVPVGVDPRGVVLVDIDGDGNLDMLTVHAGDDDIGVRLGNGDGTFDPMTRFPVGSFPLDIQVGDLDRDGWLDLVVSNTFGDSVSVLLGNGDGTFRPARSFAVDQGPRVAELVDMNGNGRLDILVANVSSNTLVEMVNMGSGNFVRGRTFATGLAPRGLAVTRRSDGRPDVIMVACSGQGSPFGDEGEITFYCADLDGTIRRRTPVRQAFGDLIAPANVVIAQRISGLGSIALYADRHFDTVYGTDIVCSEKDTQFWFGFFDGVSPTGLAAADLDGDGFTDIMVSTLRTFTSPGGVFVRLSSFPVWQQYDVGSAPVEIAYGDLTGNGRLDIVTANSDSNDVSVLLNQCSSRCRADMDGDGQLTIFDFLAFQNAFAAMDPVADFDGDGQLTIFDFLAFQNEFAAGCP